MFQHVHTNIHSIFIYNRNYVPTNKGHLLILNTDFKKFHPRPGSLIRIILAYFSGFHKQAPLARYGTQTQIREFKGMCKHDLATLCDKLNGMQDKGLRTHSPNKHFLYKM